MLPNLSTNVQMTTRAQFSRKHEVTDLVAVAQYVVVAPAKGQVGVAMSQVEAAQSLAVVCSCVAAEVQTSAPR